MQSRRRPLYNRWIEQTWDDMRMGASNVRIPAVNGADFAQVGTTGLYLPEFEDGKDDEIRFELQLSHGYQPGDELRFHIHYLEPVASLGSIAWKLYYQIKRVGGAFSVAAAEDSGNDLVTNGLNTVGRHSVSNTHVISGSGLRESSCMFGSLKRESLTLADTFGDSVFFLSMDVHFRRVKLGTREEYPIV